LKALRVDIEDYSADVKLRAVIRSYNDVITDYLAKSNTGVFIHTKHVSI